MTTAVQLYRIPAPEARRSFEVAECLTISEIIARALPGAPEGMMDRVVVAICYRDQHQIIPRAWWSRVRPHGGTTVIIRVLPGVSAVATWVASAIGTAFYAATATSLGAFALNAIWVGTAVATTLLIGAAMNALIPRPSLSSPDGPESRYSINGWSNDLPAGKPIPLVLGKMRMAPVYAALPYSQIINGEQYVCAAFTFGYGRLKISDIRIGDTSIDEFTNVLYRTREGVVGDDPMEIVTQQVFEENVNVELKGPQEPLDEYGNPTGDPAELQTNVYETCANATEVSIIVHFPQGLTRIDSDGDPDGRTVRLRIRQRESGTTEWSEVQEVAYSERTITPFFRQFRWALPSRGSWEVEITRLTESRTEARFRDDTTLFAFQSIRPEYPINFDAAPLALVEARVKATEQINGTISRLNALVERYVYAFDGVEARSEGLSRNPADIYADALRGAYQARPVPDTEVDWDMLDEWWQFCKDKGLRYDATITTQMSFGEMLSEIAAAGRASPRHDGEKWGVVIDRPQDVVVDHISPRNSWGFEGERSYIKPPDGIRVRFLDETDDFSEAELIHPWPGNEGAIDLLEEWEMPGKTNPDEVARETFRRMQEVIQRRDTFRVMQEGAIRAATRGDKVLLSHDVLSSVQVSGKVLTVDGSRVVIDEPVTMEAGRSYALRWMAYDEANTVGDSAIATVTTSPGTTQALLVQGDSLPAPGDLVLFGPCEEVSFPCRVLLIEPGENFSCRLTLTNDAEEIDTLTDAYVPPDWNPIVGSILTGGLPNAPVFTGLSVIYDSVDFSLSIIDGWGSRDPSFRAVRVSARMPDNETVQVGSILVQHRLDGEATWDSATIYGREGAVDLEYEVGDEIEIRLTAYSVGGAAGGTSSILTYTVADTETVPDVPDTESILLSSGLGYSSIDYANGDPATDTVLIFRTAADDTFDAETDLIKNLEVELGVTSSFTDGDRTRPDILSAGDMDDPGEWTAGGGWLISGGSATHTPSVASTLSQALSLSAGTTYRGAVTVSGRTAGSITVQLAGGTPVATAAIDVDGQALFSLTAVSGNDRFEIVATSDFDGSVTEIVLYAQTAATAPQGAHEYRFAAVGANSIVSSVSDALPTTII